MKARLMLVGAMGLMLAGCSSVSGTRTLLDGSQLRISSVRFLWSSEGVEASTKDQQGFEFTLKLAKSNPDVEAIKAVAAGVAEGAVKGATIP